MATIWRSAPCRIDPASGAGFCPAASAAGFGAYEPTVLERNGKAAGRPGKETARPAKPQEPPGKQKERQGKPDPVTNRALSRT